MSNEAIGAIQNFTGRDFMYTQPTFEFWKEKKEKNAGNWKFKL